MIASIHQPSYLPWLGYFHKIAQSGVHVFLDDAEYSKNNLFNRNKIKTRDGEIWLTVPVKYKGNSAAAICETKIDNTQNWRKKHLETIRQNYCKAPFWEKYAMIFEKIYAKEWEILSDLNIEMGKILADLFGIKVEFIKSSDLKIEGVKNERLVNICKAVGANVYISGAGAKAYMDDGLFLQNDIKVFYQDFQYSVCAQCYGEFVPNLSAIDFLFNCGGEKFREVRK